MAKCPNCGNGTKSNFGGDSLGRYSDLGNFQRYCRLNVNKCAMCGVIFNDDVEEFTKEEKKFFSSDKFKEIMNDEFLRNTPYPFHMFMAQNGSRPMWYKALAYAFREKNDFKNMIRAFNEYAMLLTFFADDNVQDLLQWRAEMEEERKTTYLTKIMPIMHEAYRARNTIVEAANKHMDEFAPFDRRMIEYIRIENLFYLGREEEAKSLMAKLPDVPEDIEKDFLSTTDWIKGRFDLYE